MQASVIPEHKGLPLRWFIRNKQTYNGYSWLDEALGHMQSMTMTKKLQQALARLRCRSALSMSPRSILPQHLVFQTCQKQALFRRHDI